ncbi:AAA family ATPase [Domibacillus enclensis]|uniref:AAA family ATPase n=1 Tax=Domibacillus enclensis TaxID=1017273 RepID=A0A1N7BFH5_9BACI|nr:MoxR family ATPase [Domibacillus enclensis]OXS74710.1 AAA family ATPase [Domibacillus enclensis]SIR50141.1 MoxR-like ATPase [Domibacillus enclensis]
MSQMHPEINRILTNMEKVITGKKEVATLTIVALLAQGHVLLEDVPGVGKTMMVRALAKSIHAELRRIQFTPDLLPSDVIGVTIYNPRDMDFQFYPGPIMGNIILADEINRTSPKTQSALLEGMEEQSVTVDGVTHVLEKPFFVMATQNPIEYEGTYPLPEAQLDRFLLKMKMGYPSLEEEMDVLKRAQNVPPIDELQPVVSLQELRQLQLEAKTVYVDDSIRKYIAELSSATRFHEHVYLGVSPRGSIALMKAAQAWAFVHNRDYVLPDDVKHLVPFVFAHRIRLKPEARFEGAFIDQVIDQVISQVSVPVQKHVADYE